MPDPENVALVAAEWVAKAEDVAETGQAANLGQLK